MQVQIQIAVVRPPFVKELGTVQRDSLISVGDLSALIYKQLVRVTLVKYYCVLFKREKASARASSDRFFPCLCH